MEKSEPSLVPGWLKGSSGSTLAMPHSVFYQDETGSPVYPRSRSQIWGDYDSPRSLSSADRTFSRRSQGGSLLERDRENHRIHTNLGRSNSSARSYDLSERERVREQDFNRYGNADIFGRDREQDAEKDFRTKERDIHSGFTTPDDWDKNKEAAENGKPRLPVLANTAKLDTDAKLKRSHSMGLSPRLPEANLRKINDSIGVSSPLPSISSSLATSIQKAVFEQNFPSLNADDKSGSSLVSGTTASISSPRPVWQSSLRSDIGRASSPGLSVGFCASTSSAQLSVNGCPAGADVWSSALAEAPSNSGIQNNNIGISVFPGVSSSLVLSSSSSTLSTSSVNVMNMAEALTQNPPRVRTPPQISAETQRLEELALKQSRQLIPVTPSLPKTMSLSDKAKSKGLRPTDGALPSPKLNALSGSSQSTSLHRNPTRPETPKHSQGKLVVLKGNKDAGVLSNLDLNNSNHVPPQGGVSVTVPTMSATALTVSTIQRKKPQSLALATGTESLSVLKVKDVADEKKSSIQAQNRSDFFNALRKKAASNGNTFTTTLRTDSSKSGTISSSEAVLSEPTTMMNHISEKKEANLSEVSVLVSTPHSNGDIGHSSKSELATSSREGFSGIDEQETTKDVDSEEEEAAFMRSLGWEENAEGTELTEEEINSFYQMRERRKLFENRGQYKLCIDHPVGSLGSSSSSMSSSDSDSD